MRAYAEKLWGAGQDDFYSGLGSNAEAARPYADFVTGFIVQNNIQSVVDLGCGDFRVVQMIASCGANYTGVDVVQPLIDDNNRRSGSQSIRFTCLDIATDALPAGDLYLIREFFQHISNPRIAAVLARLGCCKCILFIDVQPEDTGDYKINKDKVHGDSSRLVHKSSLRLDASPFNVRNVRMVLETGPPNFESYLPYGSSFKSRTLLWAPAAAEPVV